MPEENNPYSPSPSQSNPIDEGKKLVGFLRGARNGFLWSLPFLALQTYFIATYGRNPPPVYIAAFQALPISGVWMLASGFIASVVDRNKRSCRP